MVRARRAYFLRIFWALFRLLIFFLRHFQRAFPRFFQALELRFMRQTPLRLLPYIVPFYIPFGGPSGPVGSFGRLERLSNPRPLAFFRSVRA